MDNFHKCKYLWEPEEIGFDYLITSVEEAGYLRSWSCCIKYLLSERLFSIWRELGNHQWLDTQLSKGLIYMEKL